MTACGLVFCGLKVAGFRLGFAPPLPKLFQSAAPFTPAETIPTQPLSPSTPWAQHYRIVWDAKAKKPISTRRGKGGVCFHAHNVSRQNSYLRTKQPAIAPWRPFRPVVGDSARSDRYRSRWTARQKGKDFERRDLAHVAGKQLVPSRRWRGA